MTFSQGISFMRLSNVSIVETLKKVSSQITQKQLYTTKNPLSVHQLCSSWKVLFFGTDSFSLTSLKALNEARTSRCPSVGSLEVVTKHAKGNITPVQKYATEQNLKLYEWPHIDCIHGKFDIGIVVSFGHLIPEDIINKFPLGILNAHGSLLPRWRGPAPVLHTILHGDEITGVTLMQIAPHQFDTGKIVLQSSCPVPCRVTTPQLTNILAEKAANLLIGCLENLNYNLAQSKDQDSSVATTAPKAKHSMASLKFDKTCVEIDRLHRAINDSFQLKTYLHGKLIRLDDIIDPNIMTDLDENKFANQGKWKSSFVKPGTVIYHKKREILCIKCKDGWIGFCTVLVEGRAKMTAKEFYNGFLGRISPEQSYFESVSN